MPHHRVDPVAAARDSRRDREQVRAPNPEQHARRGDVCGRHGVADKPCSVRQCVSDFGRCRGECLGAAGQHCIVDRSATDLGVNHFHHGAGESGAGEELVVFDLPLLLEARPVQAWCVRKVRVEVAQDRCGVEESDGAMLECRGQELAGEVDDLGSLGGFDRHEVVVDPFEAQGDADLQVVRGFEAMDSDSVGHVDIVGPSPWWRDFGVLFFGPW